jgi:carboxypeptidase Taq
VDAPIGNAASLGIHESQSRLWENQVGRSAAFWHWCFPRFRDHFGDAVSHLTEKDVFEGSNTIEPGLIRVEADEATYNMHIMIRFELERLLMNGELDPADLPDAWNARYDEYLGVKVPNHANGCMQDIHWAGGLFGYFPTYTLGNLYCAQIFGTAREQIGDLDNRISNGDFAPLKEWLNSKVHAHGRRYRPAELCEQITGRPLEADPLLAHLEGKLTPLYGA